MNRGSVGMREDSYPTQGSVIIGSSRPYQQNLNLRLGNKPRALVSPELFQLYLSGRNHYCLLFFHYTTRRR
jgi:hypothetical protein